MTQWMSGAVGAFVGMILGFMVLVTFSIFAEWIRDIARKKRFEMHFERMLEKMKEDEKRRMELAIELATIRVMPAIKKMFEEYWERKTGEREGGDG